MCKHEGGSSCKANSGRNTNPQVPAVWVPACRATELYPVIWSSWRSNTAVRSYIAVSMFSEYSVPFCKIMTTNESLPQKISSGTKTSPGEAYLVAKNCLPGVEMCPLLALTKSDPERYKYQTHNENATQRFKNGYGWQRLTQWRSRRSDGGSLPVHDAKVLHISPRMHRRVRQKQPTLLFATLTLTLNFPFHCAILNTKAQHLRNKNHRLEERTVLARGDKFWQHKVVCGDQIWQLKVVWEDHFWLFRVISMLFTPGPTALQRTQR